MSEVKRYAICDHQDKFADLTELSDGPLVFYSDYALLESKANRLREAVQRWADYISDKGIEAINLDGLPRWVGAVDEEVQLLDALAAYQAGTGAVDAKEEL